MSRVSVAENSQDDLEYLRGLRVNKAGTRIDDDKDFVLIKSLRSAESTLGPVDLSQLTEHSKADFSAFNLTMINPGMVLRYGVSLHQVPKQARPFMTYSPVEGWGNRWSVALLDNMMSAYLRGEDISCEDYPGSAEQIELALKRVRDATYYISKQKKALKVLVAGSISPWVETLILGSELELAGGLVYVTDYNKVEIEDGVRIEFIGSPELQNSKKSPEFDVIVSYSSTEHDGSGRYGDPIDPNGDFAAFAEFHLMLRDHGFLIVAIPTVGNEHDEGNGIIDGNAHRIYSSHRYNKLFCGYSQIGARIEVKQLLNDWQHQPVFTLQKTKSIDCYLEIIN